MTVQKTITQTGMHVTVTGRMITNPDVAPLKEHIQNVIDQNIKIVTVDFSNVTYFGAAMLGVLVDCWKTLNNAGGTLKLSGLNTRMVRIFQVAKLDGIFNIQTIQPHNLTCFPKTTSIPILRVAV